MWVSSFKSLAIIQLHALSLLQKTVQIRDQFFLYMDPLGDPPVSRAWNTTTRARRM